MASEDKPRVLIIDGMGAHLGAIWRALVEAGMEPTLACGDQEGLESFYALEPDLVLLDTGLPVLDPWEVCRRIRSVSDVPIIVLAAVAREEELLHAFRLGADEYQASAANPALLVARAQALLRRVPRQAKNSSARVLQAGNLCIDTLKKEARLNGKRLPLSARQLELLACLVRNAGRVVTHKELLGLLWGGDRGKLACLAVYIRHLRWYLEEDPHRPKRILTVRGVGYRFASNPACSPLAPPGGARRRRARAPTGTG